jgi:DNA (cytosine-5)-methyltransferase 1
MEVRIIGNMDNTIDHTFESANRVYDKNGLSPTIPTCAGGNIQPKVIEETKCVGGLSDSVGGSYKYIVAMRGRGENNEQQLEPNTQGVVNALTTVQKDNLVMETPRYRIRKLTPKECWRLMGYTDEDFDKAAKVNSNTQLYKQAGNAIVKQVLMAIFQQLRIQGKKRWNEMNTKERSKEEEND